MLLGGGTSVATWQWVFGLPPKLLQIARLQLGRLQRALIRPSNSASSFAHQIPTASSTCPTAEGSNSLTEGNNSLTGPSILITSGRWRCRSLARCLEGRRAAANSSTGAQLLQYAVPTDLNRRPTKSELRWIYCSGRSEVIVEGVVDGLKCLKRAD